MTPMVSMIVPVYNAQKTIGRCVDSILNQTYKDFELIRMKRTVFACYNDFYKDVFDEAEYEKRRIQIYRFLIEAAGDGDVAPLILPGSYRLGAERTNVSEAVQEGEGFFFDIYRERKLQERLFDAVALKNELSVADVKLLYYLSQPHENCTFREMSSILNIGRRELSQALQRLLAKEMIEVREKTKGKTKEKTKSREKTQEEKRRSNLREYIVTAEADAILSEVLSALSDFEQLQYEGFSQEEIRLFETLNEKRNRNIKQAIR